MMLYEGQDGPQDFSAGRQDGPKRGQDGNIGVLKYARAYAQHTGFFDFVARRLCLKLLAAKSKKNCVLFVFCA